ncbi:MAG: hypothetical protein CME68_09395 [Halobacteriovoraceae bacterium]|nr:hypothetical protein [Halobacteriovoraceae bacterium]
MVQILIIEDEELVAEIIKDFIKGEIEVTFHNARTAEEGLDLTKKNQYNLIIADYVLPKMSGADFAKIVREEGIAENTPIVFVTGSLENCRNAIQGLNNVSFIEKPWKVRELIQEVCSKVERKN